MVRLLSHLKLGQDCAVKLVVEIFDISPINILQRSANFQKSMQSFQELRCKTEEELRINLCEGRIRQKQYVQIDCPWDSSIDFNTDYTWPAAQGIKLNRDTITHGIRLLTCKYRCLDNIMINKLTKMGQCDVILIVLWGRCITFENSVRDVSWVCQFLSIFATYSWYKSPVPG